jgi:preprotein translocase subunit SecD
MRLTFRIWILGIILAFSLISIINSDPSIKLVIFILSMGILFGLNFLGNDIKRFFIVFVLLGFIVFFIYGSIETGVLVHSVGGDSAEFDSGLRPGGVITSINGENVVDVVSYVSALDSIELKDIGTRIDIGTKSGDFVVFTNRTSEIVVEEIPKTNIKTGLDLSGGARALVQAEEEINDDQLTELVDVTRNRFNVFGLSDVNVRGVKDLDGNKFMLVEVAGATPDDLENLVAKQGKFEAKIGNETVFVGGEDDISDVCRNDASCSGVQQCFPSGGQVACQFSFVIYLREAAAQRHADITEALSVDPVNPGYLSERLFLFVDDQEVDSLLIGKSLQGQVTTQISIQGSGFGVDQESAIDNAREEMNKLQTVMITGSLPYTLEIVKLDSISPVLGDEFIYLILLAGGISLTLVGILIFVRYKNFKASLALLFTSTSELVIILGVASLINWNLDLPSIAGILATIGTGVDQQIVILDEAKSSKNVGVKERMKRAMFIIGTAYLTSVVSLIPLYWAGAGLFKGFAFTTIIGITAGVLITRPAFADMVRKMEGD